MQITTPSDNQSDVLFPIKAGSRSPELRNVISRFIEVDGIRIFVRESGDPTHPVLLLLHGFPTSSFYFRNLIPLLADRYHVIAPDYPGFGHSDTPAVDEFTYSFERLTEMMVKLLEAMGVTNYAIYMHDYGGPVGMRLAIQRL